MGCGEGGMLSLKAKIHCLQVTLINRFWLQLLSAQSVSLCLIVPVMLWCYSHSLTTAVQFSYLAFYLNMCLFFSQYTFNDLSGSVSLAWVGDGTGVSVTFVPICTCFLCCVVSEQHQYWTN